MEGVEGVTVKWRSQHCDPLPGTAELQLVRAQICFGHQHLLLLVILQSDLGAP